MYNSRPILFALLILMCLGNSLRAQHPVTFTAYHDPEIRELFRVADSLRWENEEDAATITLKELMDEKALSPKQTLYGKILSADIRSRSGDLQECISILNEIKSKITLADELVKADYNFVLGNYYHNIYPTQYDSAFILYRKCEDQINKTPHSKLLFAYLMNRIGEVYYYGFQDLPNARRHFNQALEIRQDLLDEMAFELGISYYNQSVTERLIGELKLAEAYAKRTIEIAKHHRHGKFELISYNLLANVYDSQRKHHAALKWQLLIIEEAEIRGYDKEWALFAYKNLSASYIKLKDYGNALRNTELILHHIENFDSPNKFEYADALSQKAVIQHKSGGFENVDQSYKKALEATEAAYGNASIKYMHVLYFYATYLREQKEVSKAISIANKCHSIVKQKWEEESDIDALRESIVASRLLGELFFESHENDKSLSHYDMADSYLTQLLEKVSMSETTKLSQAEDHRKLYVQRVQLSMNDDELSKKYSIIYEDIEKTKYRIFDQNLKLKQALSTLTNDSVSIKRYQIQNKINELEAQYYDDGSNNSDLLIKINNKKRIASQLISHVSAPRSYDLEALQNLILKNEILINIFICDTVVYLMLMTEDNVRIFDFPWDSSYIETVEKYYQICSQPRLGSDYDSGLKEFSEVAYQVFIPFKHALDQMDSWGSCKLLTIIPDGVFHYVPFESMLLESVEQSNSYSNLPYLIHHTDIGYQLSGTSLLNERKTSSNRKAHMLSLLAIGPRESAFLSNAIIEVEEVGKTFKHSEITLNGQRDKLLNIGDQYNIIHLAGHADIDTHNYQLNRLRFGSPSEDSTTIYNYELSSLTLNSDLVVLNACKTSLGEEFTGEGVYSFTQALILSGARSVISSLWEISDQSSSQLVGLFYGHLKKGESINIAINSSKRAYLANAHPESAHPYFWAYMIANGATDISFGTYRLQKRIVLLMGILFSCCIGLIVVRVLKSKT